MPDPRPPAGPAHPDQPAQTEQPAEQPADQTAPADPAKPAEQPTPRDRLRSALRAPSRRQVVVAILLAALGFAVVTQVNAASGEDNYEGLREQDLIDVLTGLAGARERAETEIDRLEGVASDLQDDTTKRRTALEQAEQEVDSLSILAGTVPVTGPGIRITITEEDGTVRLSSLLDTIQELRTVGAEAMQINGSVRIVAQTSFEATTGGFLVDDQLVEGDYVIDVIGDPATLAGAIDFSLGPKHQLNEDGASVVVDELASLDIESVREGTGGRFAEPDPAQ